MNNDYLKEITRCISYIENNLEESFTIKDVIQDASYSYPHLERVFMAIVGVSMNSYIRQRRLTKAAQELIMTQTPIIDLALKYNFSSQQTFTRAFHDYFRQSPNKFRQEGKLDKRYDSFEFTDDYLDKLKTFDVTIERMDAFQVLSCYIKNNAVEPKQKDKLQEKVISKAWNHLIQYQMAYEYKKCYGLDAILPRTTILGKFMIENKLHIQPNTRYFGFTDPYPYDENEFGYETWAMIKDIDSTVYESIPSDKIKIKSFEGGLYATTTASYGENSNLDEVWRYLHYWLSKHKDYTYGNHPWLEEHLTLEQAGGFHGFKLYLPIASLL